MCHSNLSEIDSYSVKIFFVYMIKNKKFLGNFGENLAATYLRNRKIKILSRNYHTPYGELDIIALDRNEIVFCEVKTRTKSLLSAQSSISLKKQQKIKLSANVFLSKNPNYQEYYTRFDVILILKKKNSYKIKHIVDAFR